MSTKDSPHAELWAQAQKISSALKRFRLGHRIDLRFRERLEACRHKPTVKFGIVMDDGIRIIELQWTRIDATKEGALTEVIVKHMQGLADIIH